MFNLSEAVEIQIRTYSEILKGGGVVAFPTETVYGLGASVWNPAAVKKVFELKGRPSDNPLIVHISNYSQLVSLTAEIPEESRILMQKFWPGPLTLVFDKKSKVPDLVSGGLDSVAVRMPDHFYALKLINMTGPLVAPSANLSGKPSPTKAEHVTHDFGKQVPVLDGGTCAIGLESTVLDVRTTPFRILRPGRISAKMIQDRTGLVVLDFDAENNTEHVVSPGVKYTHYAPNAEVRWMTSDELNGSTLKKDTLYLTLNPSKEVPKSGSKIILFDQNPDRLAAELYDWFRYSDLNNFNEIAIQPLSDYADNDITTALVNRIEKAIAG
jgi:L-threonylcarbamoyladenylate synthase